MVYGMSYWERVFLTKKINYDKLSKSIKAVTKNVAERSMLDASKVLKGGMDTANAAVSVYGSWKKKRLLLSK